MEGTPFVLREFLVLCVLYLQIFVCIYLYFLTYHRLLHSTSLALKVSFWTMRHHEPYWNEVLLEAGTQKIDLRSELSLSCLCLDHTWMLHLFDALLPSVFSSCVSASLMWIVYKICKSYMNRNWESLPPKKTVCFTSNPLVFCIYIYIYKYITYIPDLGNAEVSIPLKLYRGGKGSLLSFLFWTECLIMRTEEI